MLNSARLLVLLEIARTGTIVAAAQALHLSPSAISHQLARLEQELGVALVERQPQSLRLTAAGVRLAEHAQAVADLMAVARDDLRAHSEGEAGVLRLGFFASSGLELLPRALSAFSANRPQVELELILGQPHELVPDLEAGRLDAAVVFEHPLDPWCRQATVDVEMFFDEPQLVVLPLRHRLGRHAVVRLAALEGRAGSVRTAATPANRFWSGRARQRVSGPGCAAAAITTRSRSTWPARAWASHSSRPSGSATPQVCMSADWTTPGCTGASASPPGPPTATRC